MPFRPLRSAVSALRTHEIQPASAPSTRQNYGLETSVVVLIAGLLLLLVSLRAFRFPFFAENFNYMGVYRAADSSIVRALARPIGMIFFRPLFMLEELASFLLLPLDPFLFHVRNFLYTLLELFLLHRVLLRLVPSRFARFAGMLLFALSKVHFTAIGHVAVGTSVITGILLLSALLFFLRFLERDAWRDYFTAMTFACLSIFTRDYGLVVVGIVIVLIYSAGPIHLRDRASVRRWTILLIPLPIMVGLYLFLRHAVVGSLPTNNAVYSPQLTAEVTRAKALAFLSSAANVSIGDTGAIGLGGLGYAMVRLRGGEAWRSLDTGFVILFWGFFGAIAITAAVRRRRLVLLPLAWMAAFLLPILLTRNLQAYYFYEALAGLAVLFAMGLGSSPRWLRLAWIPILGIYALNGAASNLWSTYHWGTCANAAGSVIERAVRPLDRKGLDSITFVTNRLPFWRYTLISDGRGPMIPEILGRPDLPIRIIDRRELDVSSFVADDANPAFDLDRDCAPLTGEIGLATGRIVILSIHPAETTAGHPFNVQSHGDSAVLVRCGNATATTLVVFGGQPLRTVFGGADLLSARVPAELYATSGAVDVFLRDGSRESNRVTFMVRP